MNSALQLYTSICSISRRVALGGLGLVIALVPVALMTRPVEAQTYNVLYNFTGGADGGIATAGLIRDAAGNLYGVTEGGGNLNCVINFTGCGVVFKLSKTGRESVLYTFQGGTDGADPQAGLIRDAQGNLYGTTARGGNPNCAWGPPAGCGTIFKLDPTGKETVLYRFKGGDDGAAPAGTLLLDAVGNLWGTTQFEGFAGSQCFGPGCGTLFRLDPIGKLTSYLFQGAPTDGSWPLAGLTADSKGNLYGTTLFGGAYDSGTVFKVDRSGKIKTLHTFDILTGDGANPTGLLMSAGKLYGPTTAGGAYQGGAVYELNPAGESVLYSFTALNDSSTQDPQGVLALDSTGNLYGTTAFSWPNQGYGTVYERQTSGNLITLHTFNGFNTDGANPMSGVIRDSAGNLYGTTQTGGTTGAGTIFRITP
jgi:uncharacterized repeat protein (TIGR03803 family)